MIAFSFRGGFGGGDIHRESHIGIADGAKRFRMWTGKKGGEVDRLTYPNEFVSVACLATTLSWGITFPSSLQGRSVINGQLY